MKQIRSLCTHTPVRDDSAAAAFHGYSDAFVALLPADFETELTKISLTDINTLWSNYDVTEIEGRTYSYKATLNIKVIDISPEKIKEVHYTDSKQIEDGFTYLLDKNGNVMKDSLGNDIKLPKYTTISCEVIETQQRKSAVVSGTLNILNTETNQLTLNGQK